MSYFDFGLVDVRMDRECKRELDAAVRDNAELLDEQEVIHESQRNRNLRAARRRRRRNGGAS